MITEVWRHPEYREGAATGARVSKTPHGSYFVTEYLHLYGDGVGPMREMICLLNDLPVAVQVALSQPHRRSTRWTFADHPALDIPA